MLKCNWLECAILCLMGPSILNRSVYLFILTSGLLLNITASSFLIEDNINCTQFVTKCFLIFSICVLYDLQCIVLINVFVIMCIISLNIT